MEKYFDFTNKINDDELREAAEIIKQGGIVIFPTETVYGIGANGLNDEAVKRLYDVKQRPYNKPISLLVSDMNMVNRIAKDITKLEYALMEEFFPGPFTIVLNKKDIVSDSVTANLDSVGIRMPEGKIARKLVEYAGVPIATPSANISGRPSGTNLEQIMNDFKGKVDCFIDGGESKLGISSTIVRVDNGEPNILREGTISKEQINKVVEKIKS